MSAFESFFGSHNFMNSFWASSSFKNFQFEFEEYFLIDFYRQRLFALKKRIQYLLSNAS